MVLKNPTTQIPCIFYLPNKFANNSEKASKPSTMEKSFQWINNPTPLTEIPSDFTLPKEMRPQLSNVAALNSIPIIDLQRGNKDEFPNELVEQIRRACKDYGFFHVINHGVPLELCNDMLKAAQELMESPPELKSELYSEDVGKDGRIFRRFFKTPANGNDGTEGKVMTWSELFRHSWHPTNDFSAVLPRSPLRYREVMSNYAKEIGELFTQLFNLISVSLGLDKDHIERKHGDNLHLQAQSNYYPPCPNPDLTLGLPSHTDSSTLTILLQSPGVCGLQVLDNKSNWISVEAIPNSFVINIGDQLQVLSNCQYKSVRHRVVTNKDKPRISVAMFYAPGKDTMVGPIEELVDEKHPPVYRNYQYKEFLQEFNRQEGTAKRVKEAFELHRA